MKSYRGAGVFDLRKADDTHLHIPFIFDQIKERRNYVKSSLLLLLLFDEDGLCPIFLAFPGTPRRWTVGLERQLNLIY